VAERREMGIQNMILRIYKTTSPSPTNQHRDENTNSHKQRANSGTNKVFKERFHGYTLQS
jgi:hypothetical protein